MPDALASLEAAHDWHFEVEYHHIERPLLLLSTEVALDSGQAIDRGDYLETALLEYAAENQQLELIVVGNEGSEPR